MQTIWKYQLDLKDDRHIIPMPKGATIISLGMQHGLPTFWAEVDPAAQIEPRYFQVHGTGHPIANGGTFIGTALSPTNPFVWHIYEHSKEHRN